MDQELRRKLVPGTRVAVTQQVAFRDRAWTQTVRGVVVAYAQKPTGSWFAHSKGDRLWLDRLLLQKEDGEQSELILDQYSRIEIEGPPGAQPPAPPAAATAKP